MLPSNYKKTFFEIKILSGSNIRVTSRSMADQFSETKWFEGSIPSFTLIVFLQINTFKNIGDSKINSYFVLH